MKLNAHELKDELSYTLTMLYAVHRVSFTFAFYRDGSHILTYYHKTDARSAGLYNHNVAIQNY